MAWRFQMNVKHEANQYQAVVWGVEPTWHEAWNWHVADGEGISRRGRGHHGASLRHRRDGSTRAVRPDATRSASVSTSTRSP